MISALLILGGIGFLIGGPIGGLIGIGLALFGFVRSSKQDIDEKIRERPVVSSEPDIAVKNKEAEKFKECTAESPLDKIIAFNLAHNFNLDKNQDSRELERLLGIYNFLHEKKVKYLYHFTDLENVASIKQTGALFSWKESEDRGIKIARPGGNSLSRSLDSRYGLESYVRLCFCEDHPMLYVARNEGRIKDEVILKVNPLVACLKGTKFSNMNATSRSHSIGYDRNFLEQIPFEIFKCGYLTLSEEEKKYYQAEILVERYILTSDILNIKAAPTTHSEMFRYGMNEIGKQAAGYAADNLVKGVTYLRNNDILDVVNEKAKKLKEWTDSLVEEQKRERPAKMEAIRREALERRMQLDNAIEQLLSKHKQHKYFPTTKGELIKLVSNLDINLGDIDTSQITDMSFLFRCSSRSNFDGIEKWNVSNVMSMRKMFVCNSNFNSDLSKWNVSNVTNMEGMFRGATQFNSDLSKWNVSNVTNMSGMFSGATQFNSDLSKWDVSKVTDMSGMFSGATQFNSDLSKWDVSNVTNMSSMFDNASVTNIISMFDNASISMFDNASKFNSDLSKWDVSKVTDMSDMFKGATQFNSDLSKWDVSKVTDMSGMFSGATQFNSDLSKWDVSKVTDMSEMFKGATQFNSDLSKWNVSNVKFMYAMFDGAKRFNSDLSKWDVSNVIYMRRMFDNTFYMKLCVPSWYVNRK